MQLAPVMGLELPKPNGSSGGGLSSEQKGSADGTEGRTSGNSRLPAEAELLSLSQEKQLHDLFNGIDQNGSGRIEEEELRVRLYFIPVRTQFSSEFFKLRKLCFKAGRAPKAWATIQFRYLC